MAEDGFVETRETKWKLLKIGEEIGKGRRPRGAIVTRYVSASLVTRRGFSFSSLDLRRTSSRRIHTAREIISARLFHDGFTVVTRARPIRALPNLIFFYRQSRSSRSAKRNCDEQIERLGTGHRETSVPCTSCVQFDSDVASRPFTLQSEYWLDAFHYDRFWKTFEFTLSDTLSIVIFVQFPVQYGALNTICNVFD